MKVFPGMTMSVVSNKSDSDKMNFVELEHKEIGLINLLWGHGFNLLVLLCLCGKDENVSVPIVFITTFQIENGALEKFKEAV